MAPIYLSSCATGVLFQKISDIPNDKGIIYLYRAVGIPLDRNLVRYAVFDGNDEQMCDLISGGYCLIYAKPGEVQLSGQTRGKGSITINIKSGHEYFVKAGVLPGIPVGKPYFILVDNKTGIEEISNHRLLQTAETERKLELKRFNHYTRLYNILQWKSRKTTLLFVSLGNGKCFRPWMT